MSWRGFEPEFAGGKAYAENRLTAVVITSTGHRSEFQYDGMGRRVCIRELDPQAQGSSTLSVTSDTKYLWDGVDIVESRTPDGGTVLQRYFQQGFVDSDGTVLLYTRDHLGSIRELTDGMQTVQARYDYDLYGRMTQVSGSRISPFGFTGHLWHSQSGLDLTLFRANDPNLGRWISRDPVGEQGGINLYDYVLNNPISLIDPTGLDARSSCYMGCWWSLVGSLGLNGALTAVSLLSGEGEAATLASLGAGTTGIIAGLLNWSGSSADKTALGLGIAGYHADAVGRAFAGAGRMSPFLGIGGSAAGAYGAYQAYKDCLDKCDNKQCNKGK